MSNLEKYGRLTILSRSSRKWRTYFLCRCDCGNTREVEAGNLRSGHTQSCGCLHPENISRTHGKTETRAYGIWCAMKARCYNQNNDDFHNYGGRGIVVCSRWLESFASFLEDMGEPPHGLTLDRKDTNGNYEKGNCRWTDSRTQARNKRNNRHLEFKGKRQTMVEWGEETGLGKKRIYARLARGWSVEKTLTTPVRPRAMAS